MTDPLDRSDPQTVFERLNVHMMFAALRRVLVTQDAWERVNGEGKYKNRGEANGV